MREIFPALASPGSGPRLRAPTGEAISGQDSSSQENQCCRRWQRGGDMPNKARTSVTTRSVVIDEAVTTVSLEDTLWDQLETVAKQHDLTVAELISLVEDTVSRSGTLPASLRTFVEMNRVRH
jgi:predicted DNA-binding ribbon-helix-helix protein